MFKRSNLNRQIPSLNERTKSGLNTVNYVTEIGVLRKELKFSFQDFIENIKHFSEEHIGSTLWVETVTTYRTIQCYNTEDHN
jgi:hypothetical protein